MRPEVFAPDFAGSVHNLSGCLGDMGRREDALVAIEEAVELYRALAAAQPPYHSAELAALLDARASLLGVVGRNREALAWPVEQPLARHAAEHVANGRVGDAHPRRDPPG